MTGFDGGLEAVKSEKNKILSEEKRNKAAHLVPNALLEDNQVESNNSSEAVLWSSRRSLARDFGSMSQMHRNVANAHSKKTEVAIYRDTYLGFWWIINS